MHYWKTASWKALSSQRAKIYHLDWHIGEGCDEHLSIHSILFSQNMVFVHPCIYLMKNVDSIIGEIHWWIVPLVTNISFHSKPYIIINILLWDEMLVIEMALKHLLWSTSSSSMLWTNHRFPPWILMMLLMGLISMAAINNCFSLETL